MKVSPAVPPPSAQTMGTGAVSSEQADARSRAIEKIMGGAKPASDSPVNQNNVAPEDFSAAVGIHKQAAQAPVEDVVEEQAPETVEEKPKEDSYSAKLAQLARRERALRAEQQKRDTAYKAREAELARREEEITGKATQYDTEYIPKSRLRQETYAALVEAGIDPTLFQDQLNTLNQTPVDPRVNQEIQALRATVAKLEKANEANQKAQEQASTDQYQAAIKQITSDVNSLVKSDPAFEAIRATKSQKDVVDLIEATFKEEGRVMSAEEAAAEVEEYLTEQLSNYSRQIKKIRARLNPEPQKEAVKPVTEDAQPKQPQMRTLTNANSTTRRPSARERAIAAMKGEKIG